VSLEHFDVNQIASAATDEAIASLRKDLARRSKILLPEVEQDLRAFLDGFFVTSLIVNFGEKEDSDNAS